MRAEAESWREKLVESAAEGNEALLDKFLESGELSEDEIRSGLRQRTLRVITSYSIHYTKLYDAEG